MDGPSPRPRGKKVRIITDEAKYNRHQRKKKLRLGQKIAIWAVAILLFIFFLWYMLQRYTQPPPLE